MKSGSSFCHFATPLRASSLPLVTVRIGMSPVGEFRYHTRIIHVFYFSKDAYRTLTYSILAYAYPRAMVTVTT